MKGHSSSGIQNKVFHKLNQVVTKVFFSSLRLANCPFVLTRLLEVLETLSSRIQVTTFAWSYPGQWTFFSQSWLWPGIWKPHLGNLLLDHRLLGNPLPSQCLVFQALITSLARVECGSSTSRLWQPALYHLPDLLHWQANGGPIICFEGLFLK